MSKEQTKQQGPTRLESEAQGIYLQWGNKEHVFDGAAICTNRQNNSAIFLQLKCTCGAPEALIGMELKAAKVLHAALGMAVVAMEKRANQPTVQGVFHA
jgi:hypothetical protein